MEFEELLLTTSEIFHISLINFKKKACKEELSDITINQCYYLDAIHRLGNPTFSDLAKELKFSKASVTEAINKLIILDYVHKIQSDEDHRTYNIYLSEKGKNAVYIDKENHKNFANYIKECLNKEETEQLTKIFEKIINCHSKD